MTEQRPPRPGESFRALVTFDWRLPGTRLKTRYLAGFIYSVTPENMEMARAALRDGRIALIGMADLVRVNASLSSGSHA